ncbi:MAG: hypothetical protein DI539_16095 [Flavobacterium psychrophilum]|nr:MAG: hypothetical protein DI539_16095 [Flavobacterium psychrophilum]
MILINSIDSTSFTLNGTRYVKNFVCVPAGQTHITIVGAYDTKLQILSSTHYNEIRVDGNNYGSQALVINALANVLFAKTASSASFNQNNVGLFNTTLQYAFTTPSNTLTPAEIVNKINLTYAFAVSEVMTPYLFQFVRPALQEGSSTQIQKKTIWMFTGGKGTYGLNQTPVASTQFKMIFEGVLNPDDIIDDDTAVITYLGEIPDGDYIATANETSHDFFDTEYTYYFSYATDGVLYYVVFVGEPGLYGGDNQMFVESDFIDSTNSDALPYIPTLAEVMNQGSTATTANNISLTTTGTGKLIYNGSEVLNTAKKAVANGVASLDSAGKIPVSQLPNAVMIFKGMWNVATNSPVLSDGTGTTGWVYKVTGAPTTTNFNFGSGNIQLTNGDYVIYSDGGKWEKSDGSDAVTSVNGYQGVVNLAHTDVGAAPTVHTHSISDVTGLTSALDGKANTNGSNASGTWSNIVAGNSNALGGYPYNDTLVNVANTGNFMVRRANNTEWVLASPTNVADVVRGNATGTWPIDVSGTAARANTIVTTAGDATFHWQNGLTVGVPPTWMWGGQNPTDVYVYQPSDLTVGTANNWKQTFVTDFNSPVGFKMLEGDLNAANRPNPSTAWAQGIQFSTNHNDDYANQLVFDIDGKLFTRTKFSNSWNSWSEIPFDQNVLHKAGDETKNGELTVTETFIVGNPTITGENFLAIEPSMSVPANIQGSLAGTGAQNITLQARGGNVGIGTTNPQHKFVVSNSGNEGLEVALGASEIIYLQNYNRAGNHYSPLTYAASRHEFTIGNVGIGTSTPVTKLQIYGIDNGLPATYIYNNNSAGGTSRGLLVEGGTNATDYSASFKNHAGNPLMWIGGSGAIGIGNESPSAKLDVEGGARIKGSLKIGTDSVNSLQTRIEIQNDSPTAYLWGISNGVPAVSQSYFSILNLSAGTAPFVIEGGTGNVGLSTINFDARLNLANGGGGNQLSMTRGSGRVLFGQGLNENNLILYGGASGSEQAYQIWHTGGNVTLGNTPDAGYKLDVQGMGNFTTGVNIAAGQNLTWGGTYSSGKATIAGDAIGLGIYPSGSTYGGRPTLFVSKHDKVAIGMNPTSINNFNATFSVSGNSDFFGAINCVTGGSFGGEILVGDPSGSSPYAAVNINYLDQKLNGLPQIINNTTFSALSNTSLNATYPSVAVGSQIVCGSVGTGVIYVKINSNTWRQMYLNSI